MKKSTLALSLLMTFLATSTAVQAAAPTADLKVIGEITPPTCNVAAPENGVYDFGKIPSNLIQATTITPLQAETKTWSVSCDAETYLTFSVVDNRADSASVDSTTTYGLGNVNGIGKIGFYTAAMGNAKVDGVPSRLFTAASGATSVTPAIAVSITKGTNMGWASSSANSLQSGKVFVSNISVTPVLATTATMGGPITDIVNLDGLMTMNFSYGL